MVIFGATGDLTKRLVMPALYNLLRTKVLPEHFALIGVARTEGTAVASRILSERNWNAGCPRAVSWHPPAVQDLAAGQIDLWLGTPDQLPLMRAGTIKAYAVTSDRRMAVAPDIPTFGEMGLPALTYYARDGAFAPKISFVLFLFLRNNFWPDHYVASQRTAQAPVRRDSNGPIRWLGCDVQAITCNTATSAQGPPLPHFMLLGKGPEAPLHPRRGEGGALPEPTSHGPPRVP